MTRAQAVKAAARRWGKAAHVRAHDRLSSPEAREEAQRQHKAARARIDAIDAEMKERLAALDWYQALKAERAEAVKTKERHAGWMGFYKFAVGRVTMGFFSIEGQGDTWEQAFAKIDAGRAPAEAEARAQEGGAR